MERRTRVRFAPSPTGPLHMGGVRTALYNYLYAKQNGGDFIIRIEDTDSHRFVPGAEKYIIEALNWCGIHPDEGVDENGNVVEVASEKHPHAPYRQSQRKGIYRSYADQLIANGYAYYAFDTAEELEAKRTAAESAGGTFIYNQKTRMELRNSLTLPEDEVRNLLETTDTWTIRFRMPENVVVKMDDLIRGHIEVNTDTLDDKVLWKRADELPTYHLANIVDDHLMEISEVIRGEEWLPSLPLHYMLYKAFGWEDTMPRFAHLSLLLKPDGKGKLSKRDGDRLGFPVFPLKWVNAAGEESRGYREDGYFPEAFVNMLAMLGWNPGDDRELFTMDELIGAFSLDRVIKSGARFNPDKARWYNKEYLRTKSDEEVTGMFIPMLESHGFNVVDCPACALTAGAEFAGKGIDFKNHIVTREYVAEVVSLVRERATFVKDIWEIAACLFLSPADYAAFGVKAGGPEIQKPVDPRRAADPRVKVFDDSLTAPFLAKDVDKFWKEENFTPAFQAQEHVCASGCAFTKESIEPVLEDYIREQGWPMGKVMNCIRLALTGASSGLGIADILSFIGSREFASRMAFAAERLGK
ncbi:MAG: glutamate--tRNA ligase [Candidatus Cryptobacteroides sp.]|nr:glutamate--tRNA ligase [Candidatus Cryptobacteroides sp.]MDY5570023.1 glutamate--tRNA ligase [Candidatus Cryptobacteroides sp.]